MGQQLRVRAKRQRRRNYIKRLKEAALTRKVTKGSSRLSSEGSDAKKAARKAASKKPAAKKKAPVKAAPEGAEETAAATE